MPPPPPFRDTGHPPTPPAVSHHGLQEPRSADGICAPPGTSRFHTGPARSSQRGLCNRCLPPGLTGGGGRCTTPAQPGPGSAPLRHPRTGSICGQQPPGTGTPPLVRLPGPAAHRDTPLPDPPHPGTFPPPPPAPPGPAARHCLHFARSTGRNSRSPELFGSSLIPNIPGGGGTRTHDQLRCHRPVSPVSSPPPREGRPTPLGAGSVRCGRGPAALQPPARPAMRAPSGVPPRLPLRCHPPAAPPSRSARPGRPGNLSPRSRRRRGAHLAGGQAPGCSRPRSSPSLLLSTACCVGPAGGGGRQGGGVGQNRAGRGPTHTPCPGPPPPSSPTPVPVRRCVASLLGPRVSVYILRHRPRRPRPSAARAPRRAFNGPGRAGHSDTPPPHLKGPHGAARGGPGEGWEGGHAQGASGQTWEVGEGDTCGVRKGRTWDVGTHRGHARET